MSYVPYDNFLREVLPSCPGVPESVAINAIRGAAIDFCADSDWLVYTASPQTSLAGIAQYSFALPNDTIFVRVEQASYVGVPLRASSTDRLQQIAGIDWQSINGTPRYFTHTDDPEQITLCPVPDTTLANALTARVVIRPSQDSTTCDSGLYQHWLSVIGHGAKARLQEMPGQPWTNRTSAAASGAAFRAGVTTAKIERNRGMARTQMVMRPPRVI